MIQPQFQLRQTVWLSECVCSVWMERIKRQWNGVSASGVSWVCKWNMNVGSAEHVCVCMYVGWCDLSKSDDVMNICSTERAVYFWYSFMTHMFLSVTFYTAFFYAIDFITAFLYFAIIKITKKQCQIRKKSKLTDSRLFSIVHKFLFLVVTNCKTLQMSNWWRHSTSCLGDWWKLWRHMSELQSL